MAALFAAEIEGGTMAAANPTMQSCADQAPPTIAGHLERWFLFGRYGQQARFHMAVAWTAMAGLFAIVLVWLPLSHLSFAQSNWESIVRLVSFSGVALGLCAFILRRLAGANDRVGRLLCEAGKRTELFAVATLLFGLLAIVIVGYCYLATAAALPLQDLLLERIDRSIGFDWVAFVKWINSSPLASELLVEGYRSTPYMLLGTMLWLCVSGQGKRLAEFLALMCLTFVGIAIGMLILPAEGAYAHYNPPLSFYENIGAGSGMWHHQLLMALRTGVMHVIDFGTPNSNCLVTFPSGHTVLAIIMTYAVRGSLLTLIPALAVNATMLVSTIPHGGHHLIDLIAGAVIAACAIVILRFPLGILDNGPVTGARALANA
jgi:membrane-associated phospholipid phosphatase